MLLSSASTHHPYRRCDGMWLRRKLRTAVALASLAALSLTASPVQAEDKPAVGAESLVRVVAKRGPYPQTVERGFWIGTGEHALVRLEKGRAISSISLEAVGGKAFGSGEIVAHDSERELALIRLKEASAGPEPDQVLEFAVEPSAAGATVYAMTIVGDRSVALARGAVLELIQAGGTAYQRHSAPTGTNGSGFPLVNVCGHVVGVTMPASAAATSSSADNNAGGYAVDSGWVKSFLERQGVEYEVSGTACEADIDAGQRAENIEDRLRGTRERMEEAQERRERAAERAEDLREKLEETKDRTAEEREELRRRIAKAEERLEEANEAVEDARARIDRLQGEFEVLQERAQKLEREARRKTELLRRSIAGGGIAVLLLVWIGIRMRRRAKSRAEALAAELSSAQEQVEGQRDFERRVAETPDVLLEVRTPEGESMALKLPSRALVSANGAVVGRNPNDTDYVINHPEVSRMHARFHVAAGELLVEDLGSMNGTRVNGEAVQDSPVTVPADAQIEFGEVFARVRYS